MVRNLNIDDQIRLLSKPLERMNLLGDQVFDKDRIKIRVIRNEVVEPTLALANRILSNFAIEVDWHVSAYDDTLRAMDLTPADYSASVIFYDFRRVSKQARIRVYESMADIASNSLTPTFFSGVFTEDIVLREMEEFFDNSIGLTIIRDADKTPVSNVIDQRLVARNGSDLSASASLRIAQNLGLQVIPELLLPPIKCLILDLDNTLYSGVLGEQGPSGIEVTDQHAKLGREIARMQSQGVLIAIASKNNESDVIQLFSQRDDLPISQNQIAVIKSSWTNKTQMIQEIAEELRLGLDYVAILDDNLGELEQIRSNLPNVYTLFAKNADTSLRMLQIGPRCSTYFRDSTGGVRNQDIQANNVRSKVINKESLSPLDLNLKLGTKVAVSISPNIDVERCIDLFARTNQFNMTLSRSKIDSIQRTNGNLNLISCEVSDSYSNSGIVSAASFEIKGTVLEFNEFVISCRVLGRELETVLLSAMIDRIASEFIDRIECVDINYNLGPRNDPAIQWLCKLANSTVEKLPVDKVCIEVGRLESARKVFNRLAR